jgi:hypothetical protein
MKQSDRSLQEYQTTLPAAEVLALAKKWFAERNGIYAAFLEKEGETFVTMRGQGGEELVIATTPKDGGTLVTGSSYLFDMQIARFFATLPPFELAERMLDMDGGAGHPGAQEAR